MRWKAIWIIHIFVLWAGIVRSQNDLLVRVLDRDSGEGLVGANVFIKGTSIGAVSGIDGIARIINAPSGSVTLVSTLIGYKKRELHLTLPVKDDSVVTIGLEISIEEGEEIIVTSTRGSRTIRDIPTRVEVISIEELEEKAVMNSANIAMLLRETTGIQVQQTSQNSGNANIRIQGLDGRYTQILRDGFPIYGGFSSGLSIMQIPPLDLRQVEVIKGSNSTLYGGGAIAGLVNLISKTPGDEPELSLMFNQTSASGSTLNAFYGERYGKTGLTAYTSATYQNQYDAENDHFSNIPNTKTVSFNPVFYYYGDNATRLKAGINAVYDDRTGGYIDAIGNKTSGGEYTEENRSERYSGQFSYEREISERSLVNLKNSVFYFDRRIDIPGYRFQGKQTGSFSEINYSRSGEKGDWIFGGNIFTDSFRETPFSSTTLRNYKDFTAGVFAQNTWNVSSSLAVESGFRADNNTDFGTFILPRISLLFLLSNDLSMRIGGGSGYKIPYMFTEEAETLLFRNLLPIMRRTMNEERSLGTNLDFNYRALLFDKIGISLNQLFFYTELKNLLFLSEAGNGEENYYYFSNSGEPAKNKGFESNIKLSMENYAFYLNYAYISAKIDTERGHRQKPLTPKHNLGFVLMYEAEEKWRAGFEAYYTGSQFLSNYSKTNDYWLAGFMVMREFDRFSLFLNFENFIDTKQSDFMQVVQPPLSNPQFAEIWAPMDGFVANGGIKINLR